MIKQQNKNMRFNIFNKSQTQSLNNDLVITKPELKKNFGAKYKSCP
jgi:hypothetical protein